MRVSCFKSTWLQDCKNMLQHLACVQVHLTPPPPSIPFENPCEYAKTCPATGAVFTPLAKTCGWILRIFLQATTCQLRQDMLNCFQQLDFFGVLKENLLSSWCFSDSSEDPIPRVCLVGWCVCWVDRSVLVFRLNFVTHRQWPFFFIHVFLNFE